MLFFCTRTPLFLGLGEVTERDWLGGVTYKVFITPRFDRPVWGLAGRKKKKRLLNGDTDDGGAQRRSCWEELLEEEGRS